MIIDPTKQFHPNHRPYTSISAVASVLSEIQIGATLDVEAFLDTSGKTQSLGRLQSLVGKCRGDAVFLTRQAPAPLLGTIRRVA